MNLFYLSTKNSLYNYPYFTNGNRTCWDFLESQITRMILNDTSFGVYLCVSLVPGGKA